MLVGWHGITINKQVRREMGCLPSGAFVFHFISVENILIIMQRTGWTVIPLDLRGNICCSRMTVFALTDLKRLHQYLELVSNISGALKEVLYKFICAKRCCLSWPVYHIRDVSLTLPKSLLYFAVCFGQEPPTRRKGLTGLLKATKLGSFCFNMLFREVCLSEMHNSLCKI